MVTAAGLGQKLAVLAGTAIAAIALCGVSAAASFRSDPEVDAFIEKLVADHQFDRRQLRRWIGQARFQHGVVQAMSRPATARPWHEYRATQITEARIRAGAEYWQRHAGTLARASATYGVPEEIIVATIGVETFYGRSLGRSNVFEALVTLAFGYPPRAAMFRDELEQFLLLTRESRSSPLHYRGSYAGALGVPQFLPSSYRRHAVDFDNDGKRDLWNHDDAIGSIANYYHSYGWQAGEKITVALEQPVEPAGDAFRQLLERGLLPHTTVGQIRLAGGAPDAAVPDDTRVSVFGAETERGMRYWLGLNNFYVITRYNRSINYALSVQELAHELHQARRSGRAE